MKHLSTLVTACALFALTLVGVAPAATAGTTTVTLTVTSGSLQLDSSSDEPVVTDQRSTDVGWTLSTTNEDDETTTSLS